MVDDEVVDGSVADDLLDVLDELGEKVDLDGVDEAHFLVDDEVGVVGYAIGQWPKSLEEVLVAVVDAHVIDIVGNGCHRCELVCLDVVNM
jgi:hypothetical protein